MPFCLRLILCFCLIFPSIASAVVAKWEGELLSEDQAAKRALEIQAEASATMDHHL